MTSLAIDDSLIPSLNGKVAVITALHGAKVYVLDLNPPKESSILSLITFKCCEVAAWAELSLNILDIGHIDMVFINAGISESGPFLEEDLQTDGEGMPLEPRYPELDVEMRTVLNVIKLSWSVMKRQAEGGSIVLTASSTVYAPEIDAPLYSALQTAVSISILTVTGSRPDSLQSYSPAS